MGRLTFEPHENRPLVRFSHSSNSVLTSATLSKVFHPCGLQSGPTCPLCRGSCGHGRGYTSRCERAGVDTSSPFNCDPQTAGHEFCSSEFIPRQLGGQLGLRQLWQVGANSNSGGHPELLAHRGFTPTLLFVRSYTPKVAAFLYPKPNLKGVLR